MNVKQHSAATAIYGANCMYETTVTSELGAIHMLVKVPHAVSSKPKRQHPWLVFM